jgi:hypothetical protein
MRGSVTRSDKSLSLYDGRERIGTIRECDGKFVAYNQRGKQLGSYDTQAEASAAISAALIRELESEIAWSEHRHES